MSHRLLDDRYKKYTINISFKRTEKERRESSVIRDHEVAVDARRAWTGEDMIAQEVEFHYLVLIDEYQI